MNTINTVTITKPDDWHCHLRDGAYLKRTVNDTAERFERAIIMPNLTTPVTTTLLAQQYYSRISEHIPQESDFTPLMTLYLTDQTSATHIQEAKKSGLIVACKLYPAGATTHSSHGVTDLQALYPVLSAMEKAGLVLCIHGETTDPHVDVFDREAMFIDHQLRHIVNDFPHLRIVLEHITTAYAVDFIKYAPNNVGATITAHHLLYNRNALFQGGIRPHLYCLPLLKRDRDQQALIHAATSGNPKFFLGTDSAPHVQQNKESACGCAGIYTAHSAIELYTEVFANANALDKLEGFASHFGAMFYQLPINTKTITLSQQSWIEEKTLSLGKDTVIPLRAGETIHWTLQK